MPEAREVTSVGQLVRWTNDPHAGGVWALWRPGQAATAHAALRAPAGRLFFAGEHTQNPTAVWRARWSRVNALRWKS